MKAYLNIISNWQKSGLPADSNSPFATLSRDKRIQEYLIRHYILDMLVKVRMTHTLSCGTLSPELRTRLDAHDEATYKKLTGDLNADPHAVDLAGHLSLILFGHRKVYPPEEEILAHAPPGWVEAMIKDALQRNMAQWIEVIAAERGAELPSVVGLKTYQERMKTGEWKVFTGPFPEYEKYKR